MQGSDLEIGARAQLKTLTKDNAEEVARHLVMAARLIDDDPALAHQHALAASRRAGRIGVVRESLAITAYQLGDFALALRELRTYRRITGNDDQLPLMADCERGLGRPERALELARSVDPTTLPVEVRVELAIVRSGARLDLGQTDAALHELHIPELRKDRAFDFSPALFASYANVLEELGRDAEAAEWFALADRAIDALEAKLAPGELESVHVVEERLEVPFAETADDGVPIADDDSEAPEAPIAADRTEAHEAPIGDRDEPPRSDARAEDVASTDMTSEDDASTDESATAPRAEA